MNNEEKVTYEDVLNTIADEDAFLLTMKNYLPIAKEQQLYDIIKRLDSIIENMEKNGVYYGI